MCLVQIVTCYVRASSKTESRLSAALNLARCSNDLYLDRPVSRRARQPATRASPPRDPPRARRRACVARRSYGRAQKNRAVLFGIRGNK